MGNHIFLILLLILNLDQSAGDSFFISAPNVFHVGVKEKAFVQMGRPHLNNLVTLHLEHESTGTVVSESKTVLCTHEGEIKTVELMINRETWSRIPPRADGRPYVLLVASSTTLTPRKTTRVLVSKHKGYIFIQTNQPIYNPSQTVRYRVFTLDHTMRPHEAVFQISVVNAVGNKIMKSLRTAKEGIFQNSFPIPSVSKMGTWKITAHYEGDEENVASREFKIQKFVLPSFDVDITMEQRYILLDDDKVNFTISARYSHGEIVKGAYHCQFGVVTKHTASGEKVVPDIIKGLEVAGSIQDGIATVSLRVEDITSKLKNKSLADLQKNGEKLYVGVFVTNIQSGEIQEAEVYLPIITHKYTIDLSRTRSNFFPGYPVDVVVRMRHPDGSPAAGVPVTIAKEASTKESWQGTTDQDGAAFSTFNTDRAAAITVDVSANGLTQRKIIKPASSPSNSFLYMTFTSKKYSVNDALTVTYNSINGPTTGYIYYMVLSRGVIIEGGSVRLGILAQQKLLITPAMVPSFRLIGYYHSTRGAIIADSIWVDVREECEIKVKVEQTKSFQPGKLTELEFDLHGQSARVALLAVDKAIYALNADNKLTPQQVFSTMGSADLGCSYNGGSDRESVLEDAGLSAVSRSSSVWRKNFGCNSQAPRQRRAVDLQQEMQALQSDFPDPDTKECCAQGFSLIPMRRTCQERVRRILLVKSNQTCADAFLKCCVEAERLRQKKILEDLQKGMGRTATTVEIEQFFLEPQYIRRYFPESFAFTDFNVNGKGRYSYTLPDSITTWEFQVITLSSASGFCVVKPYEVRAFKKTFVSLRLPYSVRRYEQLAVSPVIYNYGDKPLQVAVHMAQTEGLCSPGSATTTSFVNITVAKQSSQFVTFSAVPMVTGSIPIKIRLYDMEEDLGIDAIEKKLNVLTEGMEQRVGGTTLIKLDGSGTKTMIIDGSLPGDTVPESSSNVFVSVEGDGFDNSYARNLLSLEKVSKLLRKPGGCLEQTMSSLTPTVIALRYLDLSDQWIDLPTGKRDQVLRELEQGYLRILGFRKREIPGYTGVWPTVESSNWLSAFLVKVLSMGAQRQTAALGQQGRRFTDAPQEQIRHSVRHLLSVQKADGSFTDPAPVLHRGILTGKDKHVSMTAFVTIALHWSLEFVPAEDLSNVQASISRGTTYLQSHLEELKHSFAIAITAYCLSVCLPEEADRSRAWTKLQAKVTEAENGCYLWTENPSRQNQKVANAITIETTAYALLAAVQLGNITWADKIACWLTTQENNYGGYRSSQDTVMVLEALAEYELKRHARPEAKIEAEFTVPGRRDIVTLTLENGKEKVETDLKKFVGKNIQVQFKGKGDAKFKVEKAFHLMEPKDDCAEMSISVTVEGKVKYTDKILENYDYYGDDDAAEEEGSRVPRSAIEWFDARTRTTRDLDNNLKSDNVVTYKVCVRPIGNLTGMAIADITLLSGFMASTKDLDKLTQLEQYIAHYEVSYGKVLLYFNKIYEGNECIEFDAEQTVPVGLLQPAPAVFYDYYEPNRKCTVFYSAPQRSKMISKLCSGDVCQCAERPCYKLQHTFKSQGNARVIKKDRAQHACFFPTVDYAYIVEVLSVSETSNFELYKTKIVDVLRSNGDVHVSENSIRVFVKRLQCKGQLDPGKMYLIMGKDGTTNDSTGSMQYLLESNTWVEKKPLPEDCKKSVHRSACAGFNAFITEYKMDGCRQ
ncbi:complement C4-B [Amphiprion ocellaris]|uniref:Complement 4B (Chido blood group) n=1 Tax=Amphiprion ocellaris TaxID=80972 RepID=A0AAQ6A7D3_AMPOC|nr:complement C4-B [Amphiprion ocellaris]